MTQPRGGYHTRQREEILGYLRDHAGEHVTAEEITNALHEKGVQIGKTTVYRCLDKMQRDGQVVRYTAGQRQSACFVYLAGPPPASWRYHMKCVHCGRVYHLDCSLFSRLEEHVEKEHAFRLDHTQTVLYGECAACAEKVVNGGKADETYRPISGGANQGR